MGVSLECPLPLLLGTSWGRSSCTPKAEGHAQAGWQVCVSGVWRSSRKVVDTAPRWPCVQGLGTTCRQGAPLQVWQQPLPGIPRPGDLVCGRVGGRVAGLGAEAPLLDPHPEFSSWATWEGRALPGECGRPGRSPSRQREGRRGSECQAGCGGEAHSRAPTVPHRRGAAGGTGLAGFGRDIWWVFGVPASPRGGQGLEAGSREQDV